MVETMLGVGLAFLLNYLDDSWQSSEEAEQLSGVPTFSIIPGFEEPKVKKGDD
jgi:protein tyrosine kinase modulator